MIEHLTVRRVRDSAGRVLAEEARNGAGPARLTLHVQRADGAVREVNVGADEWAAFVASVDAMQKIARLERAVEAARVEDAPVTRRRAGRLGYQRLTLPNGIRVAVGPQSAKALATMAAAPERWWTPKALKAGRNVSTLVQTLFRAGMIERNAPYSGAGKRGQYRILPHGLEVLRVWSASR